MYRYIYTKLLGKPVNRDRSTDTQDVVIPEKKASNKSFMLTYTICAITKLLHVLLSK